MGLGRARAPLGLAILSLPLAFLSGCAMAPADSASLGLPNLLRISERVYSGGTPTGEAGFRTLARKGVQTVVSVDGAVPDVEKATRHGMRYVHIPLGYDGIAAEAALALTRVVRETQGPVYIHCHHGRHRAPAAAAIACIASGAAEPRTALKILRRAGTDPNYTGLWRDVARFVPPEPGVPLPELVAIARVDSLVSAMAALDRAFDNLKRIQDAGWHAPHDHPDLAPEQEALLAREALSEAVRNLASDVDVHLVEGLRASRDSAERLQQAILANKPDEVEKSFGMLARSCVPCHRQHRDRDPER